MKKITLAEFAKKAHGFRKVGQWVNHSDDEEKRQTVRVYAGEFGEGKFATITTRDSKTYVEI